MRKVGFLNVPSASIIHQIRLFYAAIVGIEALLSNNMSAVTQAAVMGLQEADEVQRPSELILSKQDGAYRNLASDERAGLVEMSRRLSLRSEEHTSELQSLMRSSYAVLCLKKKKLNK